MRLSIFDRILLALLLLIVIALTLGSIAFGLFVIPLDSVQGVLQSLYANKTWTLPVILGSAVLVLAIALRLFWVLCSGGKGRTQASYSIRNDETGVVNVTVKTFLTIIHESVASVEGVHSCQESIKKTEDGIEAYLRLTLDPQVEIPQKTEEVQQAVITQVGRLTGMPVTHAHVIVDRDQPAAR